MVNRGIFILDKGMEQVDPEYLSAFSIPVSQSSITSDMAV